MSIGILLCAKVCAQYYTVNRCAESWNRQKSCGLSQNGRISPFKRSTEYARNRTHYYCMAARPWHCSLVPCSWPEQASTRCSCSSSSSGVHLFYPVSSACMSDHSSTHISTHFHAYHIGQKVYWVENSFLIHDILGETSDSEAICGEKFSWNARYLNFTFAFEVNFVVKGSSGIKLPSFIHS
jgi:hypothetical protein